MIIKLKGIKLKNKKHFMRTKQIYIGLVVLMLGVFAVGAARAQPQQPSIRQGLLSKLIEIKYTSELYLSSAIKQGLSKDSALPTIIHYAGSLMVLCIN